MWTIRDMTRNRPKPKDSTLASNALTAAIRSLRYGHVPGALVDITRAIQLLKVEGS